MAQNALQIAIQADTTDINTKMALLKAGLQQTEAQIRQTGKAFVQTGADATVLTAAMSQQTATATAYRAQISQLTAAHREHGGAVNNSLMAYMELGHVAKASFDEIAAGGSPLRVIETEGARVVQAFTELNAATQTAIIRFTAIAGPIAVVAAGLGLLALHAHEAEVALVNLDNSTASLGRVEEVTSGETAELASDLAKNYALGATEADKLVSIINKMPEATLQTRTALVGLAPAIAKATGEEADAVTEKLARAFSSVHSVEQFAEANRLLTPALEATLKAAKDSNDTFGAQAALLPALQSRFGPYSAQVQQYAQANTV